MQRKILARTAVYGFGFLAAVVAAASLSLAPAAVAQTSGPQFMITWQASNSYAPPGYVGKILPNLTSHITASLELVLQGEPIDLTGQTIYWYQDDTLLGGGIGAQTITFRPFGISPAAIELKVEIPSYSSGVLIRTINIPVAAPQAVIIAPYPNDTFSTSPVIATALPYFFNVTSSDELGFAWSVNGETVTSAENPQSLQVSLPGSTPAGYAVGIALTVQNAADGMQATSNANLTYQKQL